MPESNVKCGGLNKPSLPNILCHIKSKGAPPTKNMVPNINNFNESFEVLFSILLFVVKI